MRRWPRRIALVLALLAVAGVLAWRPWSHPTLAEASVVLPAPAGVTPLAGRGDVLAVVFSGDGGWRDLDKQLGEQLNARGIPVVGVSMLEYYWHGGSAGRTARELDALLDAQLAALHKRRLWFVGFSFGADVLPTVIGHLRHEHRARIAQLVLLSPTQDLNFEIELEGYMQQRLGWLQSMLKSIQERLKPVPHYPALPPLLALGAHPPVECYYGTDEADDTICTDPRLPPWVRVHAMAGDHHMGGDYGRLAQAMIAGLPAAEPVPR
ncbi:AcvB/VirJ family lysyl-phosphatidylglycerol hydrolase [Fulvimonas soli]|uniref:Virulence protein VirJ n=1 Tax=Fulvimonas soli TaxID=155197 RepID=A0A316HV99_9GAMM|nr:AcvB/VirJ family lysyl-phosphatidylglycerol hydrolase [Fulvimonas soli]PWK84344.1 virulence protein VirJ [Fulvimonas soli]TNY26674.1 virulence protein [Fulvimonas soli]